MVKIKDVAVVLGDPKLKDFVKLEGKFSEEDFKTINLLKEALESLKSYDFFYLNNHSTLFNDLKKIAPEIDCVVNFCDEGYQNNLSREADIPEFLEKLNILYTGANPQCIRLCYDKSKTKKIASQEGIPVANEILLNENEKINKKMKNLNLTYPAIVKPNFGDGSFAISSDNVVYNYHGLCNRVENVKHLLKETGQKQDILIEDFLPGKELSAAVIGNSPKLEVRLIEENFDIIQEHVKIISYRAKWDPNAIEWNLTSILPTIPKKMQKQIEEYSSKLFLLFECRDYARFDWKLDKNGNAKFLEANPNCGWCWDGHLVKAFSLHGKKSYAQILQMILHAAEKRFKASS